MDHKPEGTPNPLNPHMDTFALDANPSDPVEPISMPKHKGLPSNNVHHETLHAPRPAKTGITPHSAPHSNHPTHPIDMIRPVRPIDTVKPSSTKHTSPHSTMSTTMSDPTFVPHDTVSSNLDTHAPASPRQPHVATQTAHQHSHNFSQPTAQAHPQHAAPVSPHLATPQPIHPSPTTSTPALGVITNANGTPTADPMNRPMKQAAKEEKKPPKKRKRTGLIIGAIICLFIAIGCGVTAILMFINGNKADPVASATMRIFTGEAPTNVMLDGSVDIKMNDQSSPISNYKIKINSEIATNSLINSTAVKINANLRTGSNTTAEFDEIYAADGDIYIKLDGITNLLANSMPLTTSGQSNDTSSPVSNPTESTVTETTTTEVTTIESPEEVDCVTEEGCPSSPNAEPSVTATDEINVIEESSALFSSLTSSLNNIEGNWLRIPTSDISSVTPENTTSSDQLTCAVKFLIDATTSNNTISKAYLASPFITSTSEGVTISNVKNPIYKVLINEQNLRTFINQTSNTTAINNLVSCMNYSSSDDLVTELTNLPGIYAEVDEELNFTRIVSEIELGNSCDCPSGAQCVKTCNDSDMPNTATVDLRFSYPNNINIAAPTDYQDLSAILQTLGGNTTEEAQDTATPHTPANEQVPTNE